VQIDPIKPKLKPRRIKRLKLKCDVLLSTSAFKVNLRRYTMVVEKEANYVREQSEADAAATAREVGNLSPSP